MLDKANSSTPGFLGDEVRNKKRCQQWQSWPNYRLSCYHPVPYRRGPTESVKKEVKPQDPEFLDLSYPKQLSNEKGVV
ncbi:hypothetical protein TNCV_2159951 [Trichonephila clavipes]|nr:hypothetical protein TNCV_2159951 [Trichonephila clavipes]